MLLEAFGVAGDGTKSTGGVKKTRYLDGTASMD